MTKLLSIISLFLVVTTTQASTSSVKFIAENQSIATNVCMTAAEYGYTAAKVAAKKSTGKHVNINTLTCNGKSVKSFAKSFKISTVKPAKQVVFTPGNNSRATELCVQAASNGVHSIGKAAQQLSCNGKSVSQFIKLEKSS